MKSTIFTSLVVMCLLHTLLYAQEQKTGNRILPFAFRENQGQITDQQGQPRKDIDFILRTPDMALTAGNAQLHYQFVKLEQAGPDTISKPGLTIIPTDKPLRNERPKGYRSPTLKVYRMDVVLLNANKKAEILKENKREEQYRYYNPETKEQGIRTVNAYEKIIYKDIYPHIDWVLYLKGQDFKYDFIVHPGGKVSDIRLSYQGADSIRLLNGGSMDIYTPVSKISESVPYTYEQESGKTISSEYILRSNTVSFKTGPHSGTLVIDPGVDWATYYGGALDDYSVSVASDDSGNAYMVGYTSSINNIATAGAHQETFGGGDASFNWPPLYIGPCDGFLAKFNSEGQLQWATYYGGDNPTQSMMAGGDFTSSVACDKYGHVYIAGGTSAENGIATPGSFQPAFSTNFIYSGFPPMTTCNAYLAQFNTEGELQWGTYYGASTTTNWFSDIACDVYGNVYAVGGTDSATMSNNIVTPGAFQTACGGGTGGEGQIVKFDSSGNRVWGTYFGGSADDYITSIACDSGANIYIAGTNLSPGMGTPGTNMPNCNNIYGNGFLAKFDSSGTRQWCTYISGWTWAVAVNRYNQLYVSGHAQAYNIYDTTITTPGAFMEQNNFAWCDYLMQMDPDNGQRNWGTYYGGPQGPTSSTSSVACDNNGNVFLAGATNALSFGPGSNTNLATPGSHQDTLNSPPSSNENPGAYSDAISDLYLAQFDSLGARQWGTYYGGENTEGGVGVGLLTNIKSVGLCVSTAGSIFLSGTTQSATAIATPDGYQTTLAGGSDAFLVKFLPLDIAIDSLVSPAGDTFCSGTFPLSVQVKNRGLMDKTDPLVIHYNYIGPSNGSDSLVFSNILPAGSSANYALGNIALNEPGSYSFTILLNYTQDDDNIHNDTLRFNVFVIAPPVADINTYYIGDTYYFSNNYPQASDTYLWDFGDGETSTLPEPTHTFAEDAVDTTVVTISNPCGSATDTIIINKGATGIDKITLADQLNVYPNPADKELFIKAATGLRLQSYALINNLGSVMQQGDISRSNIIRLGAIAPGVYILRINTDKGVANKQVVIQNNE